MEGKAREIKEIHIDTTTRPEDQEEHDRLVSLLRKVEQGGVLTRDWWKHPQWRRGQSNYISKIDDQYYIVRYSSHELSQREVEGKYVVDYDLELHLYPIDDKDSILDEINNGYRYLLSKKEESITMDKDWERQKFDGMMKKEQEALGLEETEERWREIYGERLADFNKKYSEKIERATRQLEADKCKKFGGILEEKTGYCRLKKEDL